MPGRERASLQGTTIHKMLRWGSTRAAVASARPSHVAALARLARFSRHGCGKKPHQQESLVPWHR